VEQLRLIKMDYNYADFSTSISPAIEKALEERKAPSSVVLDVFKGDSFTVGFLDDPEKSLDLAYCKQEEIIVRRRQNTGGAIWGPNGAALIGLYIDTMLPWVPLKTIKDAFHVTLTSLADAFRELFNINAVYRPLNDVEVEGRKLVPTSARLEKYILTMRLLVNVAPTNRDIMAKAIKTPIEKMQDKKIKDVGARFTCLETEVGRKLAYSELVQVTNRTIKKIFGEEIELISGNLTELEKKYAKEFQTKYTSDEWFYANSESMRFKKIPEGAIKVYGVHKAPAGLIRVTVLICQNKIYDLIITGDFHPTPYQVLRDMEDALRGNECNVEVVRKGVKQIFDRSDVEIAGTEIQDFVEPFIGAFKQVGMTF
jgi:lipoate-protein ligase A